MMHLPNRKHGRLFRLISAIGKPVILFAEEVGRIFTIIIQFFNQLFRPPLRLHDTFRHMEQVGVGSLLIVMVTGIFTGMVFAVQLYIALTSFGASGLVGSTVGLSLTRELSPVFCALMVTGRIGSAMAATLGSMRVSEQIDALDAMAVNPVHYLVVPRIVAATSMMPLLVIVFDTLGIGGAYLVGVNLLNVDEGMFMNKLWWYVDPDDFWKGMIKGAVFGFIFSAVGCAKGYFTTGGADGVGKSTTEAVVISSVTILIIDYFLTRMMW